MTKREQLYGVQITFPEAMSGYWNGGKKRRGTFTPKWKRRFYSLDNPRPKDRHPGCGYNIRWGCFRLNFWFTCKSGRSWREAASIAKRKLSRICTIPGASFTIVEL